LPTKNDAAPAKIVIDTMTEWSRIARTVWVMSAKPRTARRGGGPAVRKRGP